MDCPCGSRISILTQSQYFINSVVGSQTAMLSSILTSARQQEPLERSTFETPQIQNHPNPSGFQKYLSFYMPFLIAFKILIPLLRQQWKRKGLKLSAIARHYILWRQNATWTIWTKWSKQKEHSLSPQSWQWLCASLAFVHRKCTLVDLQFKFAKLYERPKLSMLRLSHHCSNGSGTFH